MKSNVSSHFSPSTILMLHQDEPFRSAQYDEPSKCNKLIQSNAWVQARYMLGHWFGLDRKQNFRLVRRLQISSSFSANCIVRRFLRVTRHSNHYSLLQWWLSTDITQVDILYDIPSSITVMWNKQPGFQHWASLAGRITKQETTRLNEAKMIRLITALPYPC